ncbi:unnamed protein product [Bemisia tabaci]|uniref:ethanolamine kinase n=1 Tax=Bemisia tabaci TaxID=7038 RepID=A0A9P0F217_BEMTA|nr:PREDICTED: ethanolamine kinase 1 isoform X2 [Bemisia tabaci]CAH0388585.1 unnamed protein product [Bemisia tabaci]
MDSKIPHIPKTLHESNLEEGATHILQHIRPEWSADKVQFKLFTDGITNKLMGCFHDDHPTDGVLVRVYGQQTDLLINRANEIKNFKFLQKAGFAPKLYATFNNGIAYEFVSGETLSQDSCKHPSVYPLVARTMAQFHKLSSDADSPKVPVLWKKFRQFLDLVPETYDSPDTQIRFEECFPNGKSKITSEVSSLESILKHEKNLPVVLCHNDLLLANILVTGNNENVTFIDYEYADHNYQAFDIGNHFAEFAGVSQPDFSLYPDEEFQNKWLRCYLEAYLDTKVLDKDVDQLRDQVNKFACAAHLFWGVWALVQAQLSTIDFDFILYAKNKYQAYLIMKEKYLCS